MIIATGQPISILLTKTASGAHLLCTKPSLGFFSPPPLSLLLMTPILLFPFPLLPDAQIAGPTAIAPCLVLSILPNLSLHLTSFGACRIEKRGAHYSNVERKHREQGCCDIRVLLFSVPPKHGETYFFRFSNLSATSPQCHSTSCFCHFSPILHAPPLPIIYRMTPVAEWQCG